MKKFFTAFALTILATLFIMLPAYADDIRVTVDGTQVEFAAQQPVIVGGRTLVPVRGVFEQLGFEVDWCPDTRRVFLTKESGGAVTLEVVLTIGSDNFTV